MGGRSVYRRSVDDLSAMVDIPWVAVLCEDVPWTLDRYNLCKHQIRGRGVVRSNVTA